MTDANVLLGRIQPDFFPRVFGPNADQSLDAEIVRQRFDDLAKRINRETGTRHTSEQIADGFLTIAVDNMANAIKRISIQRGYDITEYTLNCFGGAAGQHACRVADALGINTIFIHELAGVLSAYGMGLADLRALREKTLEVTLQAGNESLLVETLDALTESAIDEVQQQGIDSEHIAVSKRAHIKYAGTDTTLAVDADTSATMRQAFDAAHRQQFGFVMDDRDCIIEMASAEAIGRTATIAEQKRDMGESSTKPEITAPMFSDGAWHDVPVCLRDDLQTGHVIKGPAIIAENNATTVIEPGWQAEISPYGHLVMTRYEARPQRVAIGTETDPVMLEIFNNLFMSIAEQMGTVLGNTSYSVNIKERLDFSCAVFDGDGELIANAPHIPVHLGSMSESVQAIMRKQKESMKPGDVWALNAPYNGGTHLPDVTVVTPVFDHAGKDVLFYVASRGHHADIGGTTPGSMPPNSRTVEEEGILLDNVLLVERGRLRENEIRALLTSGPYPARNPDQNVADLKAQIAANEKGVQELLNMVDHFGLDVVSAYMQHVQDNAEESVRRIIGVLPNGEFVCDMDCGATIRVKIGIDAAGRKAVIDFTGTSDQQDHNFNAPFAVTRAAVLYVFRTLVDDDIPLNAGCLKPLDIIVPEGSMLNPRYPAAVVAGNVETSQVIVNTLYGALGVMAAAQGTMNNFTFGNDQHQYYETICGGSGAGENFDGTDAIQMHMTNSRLTDPEVLEWRHPVMVNAFSIRHGSGGAGIHRGGNGVIRKIQFREPMTAALLSNNRENAPFGIDGGEAAQPGRSRIERQDGRTEALGATDQAELAAGDVIVIETPGGGGYGKAE